MPATETKPPSCGPWLPALPRCGRCDRERVVEAVVERVWFLRCPGCRRRVLVEEGE